MEPPGRGLKDQKWTRGNFQSGPRDSTNANRGMGALTKEKRKKKKKKKEKNEPRARLLRQARGFLWCRRNGALPLYSSLPRPFLPSGGGRNRDKGIAHLALQAWENSIVPEMRTIKRPSDRLRCLHELRARLPVRLGSANAKYQMAPACQLLNPVQQEAGGSDRRKKIKRKRHRPPGTLSPNR